MSDEYKNTYFKIEDKNIILFRTISCGISFICCFFLMIVYFILILQVKLNLCIKKEKDGQDNNNDIDSLVDSQCSDKKINKKKDNKIGLGSNFMFLLTLSNFFGSLFEFLFYFLYISIINSKGENESLIYIAMNGDIKCTLLGFAHNFFDLFAVCWTTMLTLLFYRSTNLSNEMLYKDNKYLLIGFMYSIILCAIFCGLPLITSDYGFSRYYCSFKYDDFEGDNHIEEKTSTKIWRYSFGIITFANNLANVLWLIKTNKYYSKKLELIKTQNKNEYKMLRKFVWIFRIFPIVLLISRIFKGFSRILIEFSDNEILETIIEYCNGFFFASTGIFDSIACTFFFSGVFWCFGTNSQPEKESPPSKECSDMDLIESENSNK